MNKFKIGDIVKINVYYNSMLDKKIGKIIEITQIGPYPYEVIFENLNDISFKFSEKELTLVEITFEIGENVKLNIPGSPIVKIKKAWINSDGIKGYVCEWFTTTYEYRDKWFKEKDLIKYNEKI